MTALSKPASFSPEKLVAIGRGLQTETPAGIFGLADVRTPTRAGPSSKSWKPQFDFLYKSKLQQPTRGDPVWL